jgi:hypothetical protein
MSRILSVVAVLAMTAVMASGCGRLSSLASGFSRTSSQGASPAAEAAAGPDCREHCERNYRVCMDSATVLDNSSDKRPDTVFGAGPDCRFSMSRCYKSCPGGQ